MEINEDAGHLLVYEDRMNRTMFNLLIEVGPGTERTNTYLGSA
jgi:hypothetical protein